MAQLRYIGSVEKTLIDVAALSPGKIFELDDDRAARLLNAFPHEYERVTGPTALKTRQTVPTPDTSAIPEEDTTGETATAPAADGSATT